MVYPSFLLSIQVWDSKLRPPRVRLSPSVPLKGIAVVISFQAVTFMYSHDSNACWWTFWKIRQNLPFLHGLAACHAPRINKCRSQGAQQWGHSVHSTLNWTDVGHTIVSHTTWCLSLTVFDWQAALWLVLVDGYQRSVLLVFSAYFYRSAGVRWDVWPPSERYNIGVSTVGYMMEECLLNFG